MSKYLLGELIWLTRRQSIQAPKRWQPLNNSRTIQHRYNHSRSIPHPSTRPALRTNGSPSNPAPISEISPSSRHLNHSRNYSHSTKSPSSRRLPSPSSRRLPSSPPSSQSPSSHTSTVSPKNGPVTFKEAWEKFKSGYRPELRDRIWKIWWLLPWIPILIWLDENWFTVMRVKGPSMIPTLNRDYKDDEPNTEDLVLVNLWSKVYDFKRGDVVAFRSPQDPEKLVIKRVIAIPGDMVQPLPPFPTDPIIIQWGQLWVEGDNPDKKKSVDSNWYGPIPRALVVGKVIQIVSPFSHFGKITEIGWKDHPRVIKRAVHLRSPDEVDAERTSYWKAEKERVEREKANST